MLRQRPEVCYLQARVNRRDSGGDGQAGNHGLVGSTQPEDIKSSNIFKYLIYHLYLPVVV